MQKDNDIYPEGVELRDFEDSNALRKATYDGVIEQFQKSFPKKYGNYRLEMDGLNYADKDNFSLKEQKDALMKNKYMYRRLRANLKLFDDTTDTLLDEKPDITIMRVPYITDRSTIIHNGSEYSILNQARLESGIYARHKANGEIESHVNAERGAGKPFRINLEPSTGIFKVDIGQSSLHLYSLLKDLGIEDEQLKDAWGDAVFERNSKKYDARVFPKAYDKLVPKFKQDSTHDAATKKQMILEAIRETKVKKEILKTTLPTLF